MDYKCLTWNIDRAPQKLFHNFKKSQHILGKKEVKYLICKKNWAKDSFQQDLKRKIELFCIPYTPQLYLELILTNDCVKYMGVEATLYGTKTLIMRIYVPNKYKVTFYKGFMDKLIDLPYEDWCLMGDWKEGTSPQKDRA